MRERKLHGWQQCVMQVQQSRRVAYELPSKRTGVARRGDRCQCLVHPDRIKYLGLPICQAHEATYLVQLQTVVDRNKRLREKLDPGCPVE